MNMEKLPKKEAMEKIEEFFKSINHKTPKEIKKIKKLAMKHSIKLGEKRKLFCKKCFSVKLKTLSTKNKIKKGVCENCKKKYSWRIK
jgi:hypothetical protein